jgi:hypothetical protein
MSSRSRNAKKTTPATESVVASPANAVLQSSKFENQKLEQTIQKLASAEIMGDEIMDDEGLPKRKWGIKKPISGKERRLRQNKRLRKLLVPKNALQSFNELNSAPAEFKVESNGQNYVAEVVFNSVRYEGYGKSKMAAKNDASEKVMRDMVISKLGKRMQDSQTENNSAGDGEDSEMKDVSDEQEDEVPMIQLASFALHKLFSEWSAEGFEIPDLNHGPAKAMSESGGDEKDKGKKSAVLRTELPPNAADMHPTLTLAMMRSNIQYEVLFPIKFFYFIFLIF